jgi:lipid-A-disaccharide synthase
VILALTCNGPGEFAGWARPLLHALYRRDPALEAHLFFVPDDYATGREPDVAMALFPRLRVYRTGDFVRLALGRPVEGLPPRVDRVHYSGGDLMHAARLHRKLGGVATSYRFSRPRYAGTFERVFAVDERNREQLAGWKTPPERIEVVGNLAIDGALMEAAGTFGARSAESELARDGVVVLPGSRRHEIANMVPMLLAAAVRLRGREPRLPIAFGISPFTTEEELGRALASGGDPLAYGVRGRVARDGEALYLEAESGERFPIVRTTMLAAASARIALTIPGTKVIELAALGIPSVVCAPSNKPEVVVINGPLQYLDRLPLVGATLKRSAVVAFARRFRFVAQPNIDAGEMLVPELRGTLTPGRIAAIVCERLADPGWCERTGSALRTLYAAHAGAAERIAARLLEPPAAA